MVNFIEFTSCNDQDPTEAIQRQKKATQTSTTRCHTHWKTKDGTSPLLQSSRAMPWAESTHTSSPKYFTGGTLHVNLYTTCIKNLLPLYYMS